MSHMKSDRLARDLLDWNRRNLLHDALLDETAIGEKFAPAFTVCANGRVHPATHANYLEFLNGFRATIAAIDYAVHRTVTEEASTVLAMTATVRRIDGSIERFEAMLLLTFDDAGLVTLWHEVYLKAG
ncbi:hypothetical protein [Sphingopyxis sp.]|uniref:hypothetical protein n=1 Tax=Sphingopyxis sp. TaxID=1908224 RepID=UPI002ED8A252